MLRHCAREAPCSTMESFRWLVVTKDLFAVVADGSNAALVFFFIWHDLFAPGAGESFFSSTLVAVNAAVITGTALVVKMDSAAALMALHRYARIDHELFA